uniref:ATP binding cassette subfamily A member 10 n=1 Tax=Sphenodon punctatus TaxID=8508 RepID=A0A8D0GYH9_SPHPU
MQGRHNMIMEWLLSLVIPLLLLLYIAFWDSQYLESPPINLGRLDEFNASEYALRYAPVTEATKEIMKKVASGPIMNGMFSPLGPRLQLHFPHSLCSIRILRMDFTCVESLDINYGLCRCVQYLITSITSNHSVTEELRSVTAVQMRLPPMRFLYRMNHDIFVVLTVMSFTPLMYFLSLNVTKEKKKFKDLMKMMGLQDFAFWLSWGLLYSSYILILSILLTFILKYNTFITQTSHSVIFFLFFLYGNSQISLAFLLSSLLKKPKLTGIVGFLLTLSFGSLGLTVLYHLIPAPLEWILGVFCPFAFTSGIVQVVHLEDNVKGVDFSDFLEDSYPMLGTFFFLTFDTLLYLMLALYFDKILPNKYGMRHSCFFFLKSTYWFRKRRRYDNEVLGQEQNSDQALDDSVEEVPAEFCGKEAIRINNVNKIYKGEDQAVSALKGLVLSIYEGQITALLGHNGAGKSTLLNILSGLCPPSAGSATIYNHRLSEMEDLEEIWKIIGVCPQFDIEFELLTVKENLKVFAKIKGIRPKEVEQEVGELRARHRCKGSQSCMSECIMYRKAFISNGRLKCVGSSFFLKRKWGIGYHLSMHITDSHVSETITSLVKQHVPNAKLSGQSEEELIYTLPFENVEKFPGKYYDEQVEEKRGNDFSPDEMEQGILSLSDTGKATVSGIALWRQQVCAMARMRFLKLKHEGKTLRSIKLSPNMGKVKKLFTFKVLLATPQIICSDIESFIHSLKKQNIKLEISNGKNISDGQDQEYNGVVKVSLEKEHFRFTIMCNAKRSNCFPVLMNVISNTLLRNFNSTQHIHVKSKIRTFQGSFMMTPSFAFPLIGMCAILSGLPPHFAMSSVHDYKRKAHSQLWTSGIYPSAYWCGQALVDIPLYWALFLSATGILCLLYYGDLQIPGILGLEVRLAGNARSLTFFKNEHCHLLVFQPFAHCLIFIFILRCLEQKCGRKTMRLDPVFRISPRKEIVQKNPEGPEGEDADVQAERVRTESVVMLLLVPQEPVICVSSLRKEYSDKKSCFPFKKQKTVATRNISFCVKKGEVLGLLGPNGAGKTTTMSMIIGDSSPTAGQVATSQQMQHTPGFLGYSPQGTPLWSNLTVQEHLEIYAAVKGLRKEDTAITIKRVVDALKLQEYLQKPARKLPPGISRKVCFALSMLGRPTVVLWDEPSTGMDPAGQQQIWKAIRATLKNKEQGAILTTHYMKEAEAVCDRVAIMVSGQLRSIGSIQYLKSKFGKDYLLEIKVRDPEQVELLHAEIVKLFPLGSLWPFKLLLLYAKLMNDGIFMPYITLTSAPLL